MPTTLDWGHVLLTPDGNEIRVPNIFRELKQLGLIERHDSGHYQLRDSVYEFLEPEQAPLLGRIRRILGKDLSGPCWVRCRCTSCHARTQPADRTRLPWIMLNRPTLVLALVTSQSRCFYRTELPTMPIIETCRFPGCFHDSPCPNPNHKREDPLESNQVRGYNYRWSQYSKRYLSKHRLCVQCEREGRTHLSEAVDHIIPFVTPRDRRFWDAKNHQALCHRCHGIKSRKEQLEQRNRRFPKSFDNVGA